MQTTATSKNIMQRHVVDVTSTEIGASKSNLLIDIPSNYSQMTQENSVSRLLFSVCWDAQNLLVPISNILHEF